MKKIQKIIRHLKTVLMHKWYVFLFCGKCGFWWRGLVHDNSKFSFTEFIPSVRYFTGTSSPIDAEIADKGYSLAWLHHRGRNPHHWEYWIDKLGTKENIAREMPFEYTVEMMCDWLAAGIVYSRKVPDLDAEYQGCRTFYYKNKKDSILLHEETQKMIEEWLDIIAEMGIDWWCNYIDSLRREK